MLDSLLFGVGTLPPLNTVDQFLLVLREQRLAPTFEEMAEIGTILRTPEALCNSSESEPVARTTLEQSRQTCSNPKWTAEDALAHRTDCLEMNDENRTHSSATCPCPTRRSASCESPGSQHSAGYSRKTSWMSSVSRREQRTRARGGEGRSPTASRTSHSSSSPAEQS